jgi:predicted Fe-S protein YdhL (DUF1289 family)
MGQESEMPVNPCVRNCCLDENKTCMGCGRRLAEILEWHHADNYRKLFILNAASQRLQQGQQRKFQR